MAKKNRRNAHRYVPEHDRCLLGWSASGPFRTVSARLVNLSVSGALIAIERASEFPGPGRVMISLGDGDEVRWTRAELLEVVSPEEGPRQLRLRLLEPVAYEAFKATVWGEKPRTSPTPAAPDEPAGRVVWEAEDSPEAESITINRAEPASVQTVDLIRRLANPESKARLSRSMRAEFPGLIEAHRKNVTALDRVEPIPWVTIGVFSTLVILLLFAAVSRHYGAAYQLGDMLALLR